MDPSFRAPFANVNRWFLTIVNQPQFKKVLGEVKLCETMAKFDGEFDVINIILRPVREAVLLTNISIITQVIIEILFI